MTKQGLTKIHHEHLEFVFNHEEHRVYVRDHMYKIEYELVPEARPDMPFVIVKSRHLEK